MTTSLRCVIAALLGAFCLFPFGPHVTDGTSPVAAFPPLEATERQQRQADIREGIGRTVTDLERRLAQPNAAVEIRDLPNAALFALATGQDARRAEGLLRRVFAHQDMNPKSPHHGSLPWSLGDRTFTDENADEFGLQALGPILLGYGERLSPEFKRELAPHLRAGIAALRRRQFRDPSYTNIFLMKSVNLILLGEALGDARVADEGYAELNRWIAYTRTAGIHEFDSATYYGVDLDSLGLGYRYARRPGAKAAFKVLLDYFWTDLAANCFEGHLAGPQSRCYDFLHNTGGVDLYLYAEGLHGRLRLDKVDLEKVYLLENLSAKGYRPAPEILGLATVPERIVEQRWDTLEGADRYHYLTRDFAIGSTSGNYGPQDKLLTAELHSARSLPVLSVVPDLHDEPYGKRLNKDRSGHPKPTHLALNLLALEHKGILLAMLDLDPAQAEPTGSLVTNVLLPARAEALVLDGAPVRTATAFARAARLNAVVGVHEGKAGVVLRVFRADSCAGQAAALALTGDDVGLHDGAVRLAVSHYRGPSRKLAERHVRVGILLAAGQCADDRAFAALLQQVRDAHIVEGANPGTWQVRATVGDVTLEAGRDLGNQRILYRRINGRPVEPHLLRVNAADLAAPLWKNLAAMR